jgi:hypothetical protein
MEESPKDKILRKNLGPTRFSGEGFLGHDNRPVDEIIADDLRMLSCLGISIDEILKALTDVYERAKQAFGAEIEINKETTAVFHESRGRVPSPFGGGKTYEKGETVVVHRPSGRCFIITRLGLVLIEKNHFFQGRGSRYRMNPDQVADILNLSGERKHNPIDC